MAKSPRVRGRPDATDGAADPPPDWRTRWKKWAVAQLGATASRAVKVDVRAAVERALARFRPDADEDELRDVIMTIVEDANRKTAADADRDAHKAIKQELVNRAGLLLKLAVLALKPRGTVAMLQRPGYSLRHLEERLRKRLGRELTGNESWPEVQARVEVWVEARLAEQPQPTPPRISATTLAASGTAILAATVAVSQNSSVQATAAQALEKGRALLTKLVAPSPPSDSKPE